jgi:hypothetical protein
MVPGAAVGADQGAPAEPALLLPKHEGAANDKFKIIVVGVNAQGSHDWKFNVRRLLDTVHGERVPRPKVRTRSGTMNPQVVRGFLRPGRPRALQVTAEPVSVFSGFSVCTVFSC